MNRTIAHFVKGTPNSGFGRFVYATLDCGHTASVTLVPYRGKCYDCGREVVSDEHGRFSPCKFCGKWMATITFTPDPWNDEHIAAKVGDTAECTTCDQYAHQTEVLRAMPAGFIHHARHNGRRGAGAGWNLYRLDHTSPSNFRLAGYAPDTPEVDQIMRQKHFATVSPTERA